MSNDAAVASSQQHQMVLTTNDGQPLKRSLARALRRQKIRALMLVAPLLVFIMISFILPIGNMLYRSVENDIVADTMPGTVHELKSNWDPKSGELPPESVFAALADDMMLAKELKSNTRLGSRLNYDQPGMSSMFRKSGRKVKSFKNTAHFDGFTAVNPEWGTPEAWKTLRASSAWPKAFPRTAIAWKNWETYVASDKGDDVDPATLVPYGFTYSALYFDLANKGADELGRIAGSGDEKMAGLFEGLASALPNFESADYKAQFEKVHDGWGEMSTWKTLVRLSPRLTKSYYLTAIDMKDSIDGIEWRPDTERIYIKLFARTIFMSVLITCSCILLGFPIAFLLANLPVRTSNLLMILVLLPFWTSLLVRTSAWKVLLQQEGVINDVLVSMGIIDTANRLVLINNMTGTVIAMTHILLPFMILPLFSVMKTISPSFVRAAKSMGANDWTAFWRIYFPNTIPGIGAGSILVFILAIGYYITPALVGGTDGIFISNRIAYHIQSSLNWGLAAALGAILLVLVMGLYWCYDKIVGIDNVKLG